MHAAAIGGVAVTLSLAGVPGARAAVTETAGAPVRGMDISAYQHAGEPIDWAVLATQGIRFVAIKASEGTYYLNPYYASDAEAAAAAGLLVMPYVFANPGRSGGVATANFAAGALGTPGGSARLTLVVDLENDPYKKATDCYGLGIPAMIAWIAGFTGRARAMTGEWPTIYTTADWWRECTRSTGRFPHDPLWLAAFGGTAPIVPSPWGTGRSGSTTMPARCRGSATRTWTTTSRPTAFPRSARPPRRCHAKHRAKSTRRRRSPSGI